MSNITLYLYLFVYLYLSIYLYLSLSLSFSLSLFLSHHLISETDLDPIWPSGSPVKLKKYLYLAERLRSLLTFSFYTYFRIGQSPVSSKQKKGLGNYTPPCLAVKCNMNVTHAMDATVNSLLRLKH